MFARILLTLLLLFSSLYATEYGTLTGIVSDQQSNQPVIGTNVALMNTKLGGAADQYGRYLIQNIQEGYYTVVASMIGYRSEKVDSVYVKANTTTTLNFQLEAAAIQGQHVELQAISYDQRMSKSLSQERTFPDWNTEEYSRINESGYFNVLSDPLSTFAADVDGAAYANVRRFIMQDQMPYPDVVRTEEFVNYFSYSYPKPDGEVPLAIYTEYGTCPWDSTHGLVHIGLRGKTLLPEQQPPSNLVFLLDVSGSMNTPKKLPLLKRAFSLLVDQLHPADVISIVVYAGNAGLVLPPTKGSEKEKILDAINRLQAGGSTAGGEGIRLAYKIAKEQYIKGGNNRVILATDGDFNVGISSTSELVRFIEKQRDSGIFITTLGFGSGNYKDNRLQELADRGNGTHSYIDTILEAKKVFGNEITATLFTIAKDVKIQVEFNPAEIEAYRLIGYENRELENKDFTDDTKDAGEIGAGHTVTTLYEVIPSHSADSIAALDTKYQHTVIKNTAYSSGEILTVRIRYKEPDGNTSKEITQTLQKDMRPEKQLSNNFRFAAAVAEFAMVLRDSKFKGNATYTSLEQLAKSAMEEDKYGYRNEFLTLVHRAQLLSEKPDNHTYQQEK